MTTAVLVDYMDQHREEFGVEPICTVLLKAGMQIGPSSYYAAKSRPPSARVVADHQHLEVIRLVHAENYGVYGVRKMHAELNRRGHRIARCTVHRLMRADGCAGSAGPKVPEPPSRVVVPTPVPTSSTASSRRPHRTGCGSRTSPTAGPSPPGSTQRSRSTSTRARVVGWQLSTSLRTDLAVDALEMGLWSHARAGHDTAGVIAHSDKGVQYLAVRYTQRLVEAGAVAFVGSTGDRYDNALAEAFNSLFEAELVSNRGPWKNIDDLEIAVAEYIDRFNHRRLHGEIGLAPPVEFEEEHYRHNPWRLPSPRQFRVSTEPGTRHAPRSRSGRLRAGTGRAWLRG